MRTIRLLLIVASLLLLASSCLSSHAGKNSSRKLSGPVEYPQGWPLPELVAPPGSEKAKTTDPKSKEDGSYGGTSFFDWGDYRWYESAFFTSDKFSDVVEHYEKILNKLNYRISESDGSRMRRYISPDDKTSVLLSYSSVSDVWQVQITVFDQPCVPPPGGAEKRYSEAQPIP